MGFHNHAPVDVDVVISALFLASDSAVSQPDDLISQICNKTDYVNVCITSVKEDIKGEPTGMSVLMAEIDASAKGIDESLAQVANLTKSASKQEKEILSTCKHFFEIAIVNLAEAKKAISALSPQRHQQRDDDLCDQL